MKIVCDICDEFTEEWLAWDSGINNLPSIFTCLECHLIPYDFLVLCLKYNEVLRHEKCEFICDKRGHNCIYISDVLQYYKKTKEDLMIDCGILARKPGRNIYSSWEQQWVE